MEAIKNVLNTLNTVNEIKAQAELAKAEAILKKLDALDEEIDAYTCELRRAKQRLESACEKVGECVVIVINDQIEMLECLANIVADKQKRRELASGCLIGFLVGGSLRLVFNAIKKRIHK